MAYLQVTYITTNPTRAALDAMDWKIQKNIETGILCIEWLPRKAMLPVSILSVHLVQAYVVHGRRTLLGKCSSTVKPP